MSRVHQRSRPVHVLHVMSGSAGGAAISTTSLVRAMRALGVISSAVCDLAGTELERSDVVDACEGRVHFTPLYRWSRHTRAPLWKRPLLEMRQIVSTEAGVGSALRAVSYGRRMGVTLVHTNTSLTLEGAAVSRRLRIPHVWHVRELVGNGAPFQLPLEGNDLASFLATHASCVIANSAATAARIDFPPLAGRLTIVENGVDLSRFARRDRGERAGRLVVAMVANLSSRVKKHALFVDAAALVPRDLPVDFRIYGHAPEGDPYVDGIRARIVAAGLERRLSIEGFSRDPAVIMSSIDVLVHPNDGESFGRVVIEAAAAGVPTVGVRGGGVGGLIVDERTGLLADVDDAVGIAARITRLVQSDVLRRELGARARIDTEARYSIGAHAARIVSIYDALLAGQAPCGVRGVQPETTGEAAAVVTR